MDVFILVGAFTVVCLLGMPVAYALGLAAILCALWTDIPLEANMIFEIETPYYEFGFGGAFIEDTVLVGQNGASIITKLQRELQVIAA